MVTAVADLRDKLTSGIEVIASKSSNIGSNIKNSRVASEAALVAFVFNRHKKDIFVVAVAIAAIVVGLGVLSGITGGASWAGIEHGLKTISIPWSIGIGSGLAVGMISGVVWATIYKPYDPTKEEYPPHNTLYEYGYHWYDQVKSSATKGILTTLAGYLGIGAGSVYPTAASLIAGIVFGNYIGVHLIYEMNIERAKRQGAKLFNSPPTDDDLTDKKERSQRVELKFDDRMLRHLQSGKTLRLTLSQKQTVSLECESSDESSDY